MAGRTDRFAEYPCEVSAARQQFCNLFARFHAEKFQRLRRPAAGIAQLVCVGPIAVRDSGGDRTGRCRALSDYAAYHARLPAQLLVLAYEFECF